MFLLSKSFLSSNCSLMAFQLLYFNNNIELNIALFSQLYQLGTRVNEEYWFFSGNKCHILFNGLPSSLKWWKNKFFIIHHRMSKGFGNLQTKWNLYVDLRKDGDRSSKGEEEALAFLQKMAMMRKMDINVAIRNVVLAWQNRFQAKKAKVLRLSTRLATRAILPPPLK